MKKLTFILCVITSACLLVIPELDARGGGGRGGGGGGRPAGGGGGRTIQRSPSMSRTTNRPTPATRPTPGPRSVPDRPMISPQERNRPNQSPRPVDRGSPDVRNSLQTRPANQTQFSGNNVQRANFVNNRHDRANDIRKEVRTNIPNRGQWFNNDFWKSHNYYPSYYNSHNDWWKWSTAASLTGWLGWNADPVYYDYYPDNGSNYWAPTQVTPYVDQSQYYAPPPTGSNDWMPLGVFALTKPEQSLASPNHYLQLAISKNGSISGTYYNSITDQGYELAGMVDPNTQKVDVKSVNDADAPILETGIYNLTQPEAPVRLYFQDGRTKDMLLTRLE